jgi:hypothetical protein
VPTEPTVQKKMPAADFKAEHRMLVESLGGPSASAPVIAGPIAQREPTRPMTDDFRAALAKAPAPALRLVAASASTDPAAAPFDLTAEQRKAFNNFAIKLAGRGQDAALVWRLEVGRSELKAIIDERAVPRPRVLERVNFTLWDDHLPSAPPVGDANVRFTLGSDKTDNSAADKHTLSWAEVCCKLTDHKEGPKDGLCFMPAIFLGLKRAKDAADRIDVMVFDLDNGRQTIDEIEARIRAHGWTAAIASTHSHMTTGFEVKKSGWLKHLSKHPGEGAPEFLRRAGYAPAVYEGAAVVREDAGDGKDCQVYFKHGPCPKFRVTLLLTRPWLAADYVTEGKPDQRKANEAWEASYRNTAEVLGFEFDRSCVDPSRLFFLPRYPPGGAAPISRVIHGKTFDPSKLPNASKPVATPEQARGNGAGRGASWTDTETGESVDLVKWAAVFGPRFKIVDALKSRVPDVFVGRVSEGKHHIKCPFADEHSDNDPGTATFAANAGETKTKGFVVSCRHAHCAERDRTAFVVRMLDDGWLWSADLIDQVFLLPAPELDEAERAVAELNRNHAVVWNGGRTMILTEKLDAEGRVIASKFGDELSLHRWYANKQLLIGTRRISVSKHWMESPSRRGYTGVDFDPQGTTFDVYNLWRGFAIEPDPNASCELFLWHLENIVCQSDPALFEWLVGWFAHIVQRPWEKPGVAVVLSGVKGGGKSIVGETIGALFPTHHVKVSTQEHLTGRFNAHFTQALLVQVEEALWAGDKRADGVLKDIITAPRIRIEQKGIDTYEVLSCTRLLLTSNSDWVVPATPGERRYAVFELDDEKAQDTTYFAALVAERENGGLGALMHHLMRFDLSAVNVRKAPRTDAGRDQILQRLDSPYAFWRRCLETGRIDPFREWPVEIPKGELFEEYLRYAKKEREQYPKGSNSFGKARKLMAPGVKEIERGKGLGRRCLLLGDLEKRRAEFEKFIGYALEWQDSLS